MGRVSAGVLMGCSSVRALPLLLLLLTGCATTLREAPTPMPPDTPTALPWSLNRELLMPKTKEIVFVVERREGAPFEPRALDDLVALAARYGGRPARWTVRTQGDPPTVLHRDTSYVFVEYVGDQLPSFGLAYERRVAGRRVYVIVVNQEAHRRLSSLIPERWLEAQTLVHEYGHLLGLPTHETGYYPKHPNYADGMHCRNPGCPLSKPRPRAVIYNIGRIAFGRKYLTDYCEACRAAIAAAQAYWRGETTSVPARTHRSAPGGSPG